MKLAADATMQIDCAALAEVSPLFMYFLSRRRVKATMARLAARKFPQLVLYPALALLKGRVLFGTRSNLECARVDGNEICLGKTW